MDTFAINVSVNGPTQCGEQNENRQTRDLYIIAREIRSDWKKVNFAAQSYLDALGEMGEFDAPYFNDSGRSVVSYYRVNAGAWRRSTLQCFGVSRRILLVSLAS